MSVGFDAKMTGGNGSGGTNQYTAVAATSISSTGMTVGVGATLLVAIAVINGPNTGSMAATWNSVAMAIAAVIQVTGMTIAIFTLVNPASGNKTLASSWTGSFNGYLSSISFTGTDTVTGYKSADSVTGSGASQANESLVVNTGSTGATVAALGDNSGVITVSTQTSIFANTQSAPNGAASYGLGGSGTNTHTFTFASSPIVAWAGIHVIAPPVATGGLLLTSNQGGF